LCHFMFAPGVRGWPTAGCPGCSMFLDNIGQFTRVHLKASDASFAVVSRAPLPMVANKGAIVDQGGPLGKTKRTSSMPSPTKLPQGCLRITRTSRYFPATRSRSWSACPS
jgi:hypothetical protein